MQRLGTYLPQDRLRAILQDTMLPDHTCGSAIFADISGFTRLTEKLTQSLGVHKGVDALSQQLIDVYGALIDRVERYGGGVISFAGCGSGNGRGRTFAPMAAQDRLRTRVLRKCLIHDRASTRRSLVHEIFGQ